MSPKLIGTCAAALTASAASAAPIALVTNGSTLYRIDLANNTTETFNMGDSIVSQYVDSNGNITAFSNTQGTNGFEVYELNDPLAANPSLSLITTRNAKAPTHTEANGDLFAIRNGDIFDVDQTTFALSNSRNIAGLSGNADPIGGSAFDPASGTFYIVSSDGNLRSIDGFDSASPSANLIGALNADARNHGMEFFEGNLYAAIQSADGSTLQVGSIDTATGNFTANTVIQTNALAATSISVVPTPGAASIMGFAALAATRRRR